MTDTEQLETIRTQTLARLTEIHTDPQPTYLLDDRWVSWESYAASLQQTLDWCDRKLAEYRPFEVRSEAVS